MNLCTIGNRSVRCRECATIVAIAVIVFALLCYYVIWPVLCFIWDSFICPIGSFIGSCFFFIWNHIGVISITLLAVGILIVHIRKRCDAKHREAEEKKKRLNVIKCVNGARSAAKAAEKSAHAAVQTAESAAREAMAAAAEANTVAEVAVGVVGVKQKCDKATCAATRATEAAEVAKRQFNTVKSKVQAAFCAVQEAVCAAENANWDNDAVARADRMRGEAEKAAKRVEDEAASAKRERDVAIAAVPVVKAAVDEAIAAEEERKHREEELKEAKEKCKKEQERTWGDAANAAMADLLKSIKESSSSADRGENENSVDA